VSALEYRERPADGDPAGLLVLHHGRGADEHDLLGLADALDPQRRLHVVTPRGPLRLPGWPGHHWYVVPRVGYPDRDTFDAAYRALAQFHDETWERTGTTPERTVLGGFSMGAVMSYALGLGRGRPAPAGVLGLSGFIPTVEDFELDLDSRRGFRVATVHGTMDPVIPVDFAHAARERLEPAGVDLLYREAPIGHSVDPASLPLLREWLGETVAAAAVP
jgi:phospholipase/carboxylesterase